MDAEGGTLEALARLRCVGVAWRDGLEGEEDTRAAPLSGHDPATAPDLKAASDVMTCHSTLQQVTC